MSDDAQLLERYVREGAETAFTELVNRHVNLVFSAALRETAGDSASAQDLTQAVFSQFASQAARLTRHPALGGWLYTTVRHVASNWRRSRQRREQRELAAHAMNEPPTTSPAEPAWEQIAPALDDAMHALREADRNALVLRYFEQRSLRDVGTALGLTENAARMRVDRALDRLREVLARRGVTSTASGLAAALVAGAVTNAPAGLAASVAATALVTGIASATSTVSLLNLMSLTKTQIVLASAFAVTAVTVPVWQQQRIGHLTEQRRVLQAEAVTLRQLEQEVTQLRAQVPDRVELERLRGAESELKLEVARLRNELGSAQRAATASATLGKPAPEGPVKTNSAMGAAISVAMKAAVEQQTVGRLQRLKPRLNLTAEQEEAIRAILTRQAERATTAAEKLFAGKLSREEMTTMNQGAENPENEIKALLTPEQLTAYAEFKQEENVSNARLVANAELLQMQSAVGLTQEQQDKVYSALYDFTLDTLNGKVDEPTAARGSDPASLMNWQFERKAKALEPVLTPEQLAAYRKVQESQMKMVEGFLPAPANAPSP